MWQFNMSDVQVAADTAGSKTQFHFALSSVKNAEGFHMIYPGFIVCQENQVCLVIGFGCCLSCCGGSDYTVLCTIVSLWYS